jgi:hypothetical protein
MMVGFECGSRWYLLHSWYCRFPSHSHKKCHNKQFFRRFPEGFAIGPLMVVKRQF